MRLWLSVKGDRRPSLSVLRMSSRWQWWRESRPWFTSLFVARSGLIFSVVCQWCRGRHERVTSGIPTYPLHAGVVSIGGILNLQRSRGLYQGGYNIFVNCFSGTLLRLSNCDRSSVCKYKAPSIVNITLQISLSVSKWWTRLRTWERNLTENFRTLAVKDQVYSPDSSRRYSSPCSIRR